MDEEANLTASRIIQPTGTHSPYTMQTILKQAGLLPGTENGPSPVYAKDLNVSGTLNGPGITLTKAEDGVRRIQSDATLDIRPDPNKQDARLLFTSNGQDTFFAGNRNSKASAGVARWHFSNVSSSGQSAMLTVTGSGTAQSGFNYNASDERLKTNSVIIPNATDILGKLKPKKYEKLTFLPSAVPKDPAGNPMENKTKGDFGLIAQEVYKECPELKDLVSVPQDPNETHAINYIGLIAVLIKGFQEQQAVINQLRTDLNQLRTDTGVIAGN